VFAGKKEVVGVDEFEEAPSGPGSDFQQNSAQIKWHVLTQQLHDWIAAGNK
jgi:hypothetical protein